MVTQLCFALNVAGLLLKIKWKDMLLQCWILCISPLFFAVQSGPSVWNSRCRNYSVLPTSLLNFTLLNTNPKERLFSPLVWAGGGCFIVHPTHLLPDSTKPLHGIKTGALYFGWGGLEHPEKWIVLQDWFEKAFFSSLQLYKIPKQLEYFITDRNSDIGWV